MAKTLPVIGIDPTELSWIRMLTHLLRHPDPVVPELTRQALLYLQTAAGGELDQLPHHCESIN
jgi:hypothetical protein